MGVVRGEIQHGMGWGTASMGTFYKAFYTFENNNRLGPLWRQHWNERKRVSFPVMYRDAAPGPRPRPWLRPLIQEGTFVTSPRSRASAPRRPPNTTFTTLRILNTVYARHP